MTASVGQTRESESERMMSIAVTGSSGLIGSALVRALESRGHRVVRVVRREARGESEVSWNPDRGEIDAKRLEGIGAVVNLAGENLAQRWTDDAKHRIRESRVRGTTVLASALAGLANRPSVILSGSAIGIYGSRGDEILDETSALGSDFLSSICKAWEGATAVAAEAGIRVVHLRTGIVLAKDGGALEKMMVPFRFGVGGRLGDGKQWMSWIVLSDIVRAIIHAIGASAMSGPVNLVSPAPVTNEQFTETLGTVLHRPSFFAVPRVAMKIALGEMAEDTVLASQRVKPARLTSAGFVFEFSELDKALRAALSASGGAGPSAG
jgi:uncharacterized protein (TIGR01777 family)